MKKAAYYIDLFLKLIKWPIAVFSIFLLPSILQEIFTLLKISFSLSFLPFFVGMLVYYIAWKFIFNSPYAGSLLPVLEHELTHALFALLTFRRIKSISATWNSGGSVRFSGSGNWLITLSPYFFPLISIFIIIVGSFFSHYTNKIFKFILGLTTMYNIISTSHEIHLKQTDLQKEGFIYSFLLIPGFLLFFYGLIWSFALSGSHGIKYFSSHMFSTVFDKFISFIKIIF